MATFTEAPQPVDTVDGGHDRRLTPHSGDVSSLDPVDGGAERRLFSHSSDSRPVDTFDGGQTRRLFGFGSDRQGVTTDRGIPIPTGGFRRVDIVVENERGERLTEVEWIMSATVFPTAAKVDDQGRATMWLLSVTYESFMAVASLPSGTDLVWYSSTETSTEINPAVQASGTVVLKPKYIGSLSVGGGASFGP